MEQAVWNAADAFCLQALKWVVNFMYANASGRGAEYLRGHGVVVDLAVLG